MNYINNENVLSIKSIGDWNVSEDSMSGTIEWYNENYDEVVYATPNWEGEEGSCPIAYSNIETGDYTHVGTVSLIGLSMEQQIEKYRNIVEEVISGIVFGK